MVGRIWLLCGRRHRGNMDMKRKGFQGALRSDLRRALGPLFWICVLLIAAVHVGAVWLSFLDSNSGSVISLYDEAVKVENYMQNLLLVLVSAVFSTAFLEDIQSAFYRFQLLRSSRGAYLGAKLSANAISTFACTWLGLALFLLILSMRFPLVEPEDIEKLHYGTLECMCGALLLRGHPFAYFLTVITLRSMAMVFWPLCAMAVSAYVPNRFVVLGTPWLVDYFIGASESRIFRSSYGNYGRRFAQFTVGSANYMEPGVALIQLLVRYLPCIALCAVLFYLGAKRRLKND